jgi:hypothetical protein
MCLGVEKDKIGLKCPLVARKQGCSRNSLAGNESSLKELRPAKWQPCEHEWQENSGESYVCEKLSVNTATQKRKVIPKV